MNANHGIHRTAKAAGDAHVVCDGATVCLPTHSPYPARGKTKSMKQTVLNLEAQ